MEDKEQKEFNRVHDRAVELFGSGICENIRIASEGIVETPLRILNPDKSMYAWYVSISIGDRLVGYMLFTAELVLMSFGIYGKDGLPKTWLNPNIVLDFAKTKAESGDKYIEQFLSWDKSPARIAWAVRFRGKSGKVGTIFVPSEYAYRDVEGPGRPGCR